MQRHKSFSFSFLYCAAVNEIVDIVIFVPKNHRSDTTKRKQPSKNTLPLSIWFLVWASNARQLIPYIFIGLLQVCIVLGLGYFVFHVPINGGLLPLFGVTLLFISTSLALGLVLSTIASDQLQSMQLTLFIILPSILLSGFIFPHEGMPVTAHYIAEALSATHYMRVIHEVILRDAALDMMPDIYWLR